METPLDPIVGNWYKHLDKGPLFMVVAIDEKDGLIELQHFDADIEEVDLVGWFSMELEHAEAPEDWTGPMDNIESDDFGVISTAASDSVWRQPLQDTPRVDSELWDGDDVGTDDAEAIDEEPTEQAWRDSIADVE